MTRIVASSVPHRCLSAALAVLGLLVAAPSALALGEQPAAGSAPATGAVDFSPNRLIVEWGADTGGVAREAARDEAEVRSVTQLGDPSFQLVRVEAGQGTGAALASLRQDPGVRAVTRDGYSTLDSLPDDPLLSQLWGLRNLGGAGVGGFSGAVAGADVGAPLAWDRTVGSPSIVIADIDSGYRFDSPDLGPVAWNNPADPPGGGDDDGNGIVDDSHGADFIGQSVNTPAIDGDPTDEDLIDGGHGVHTAGTMGAAGDNGVGITGVAQDVRLMPLRVCSYYTDPPPAEPDESRQLCLISSEIAAINYAGSHGARVANMSLGGTSFNSTVRDALAQNPQTLFVISAGNDSEDNEANPHYPCDYEPVSSGIGGAIDNVVCVAATDQADGLAGFSDWGASSVDLGAPGTETLSTFPAQDVPIADDFEANDFSSTWEASGGTGMGRAAAGDGPLTSFGMTDSPGGAPAPNSVHETTLTTGVPLPVGTGACTLSGMRFRRADAGSSFFYQVLSDGSPVFTNTAKTNTAGSQMASFNTTPIKDLDGHSVKVRFGYTAGPSPTVESGFWLDDLKLSCYAPLSTPPGYAFLQGTSMAAPHVSGAAGLLFSLEPAASVTEVRAALLAGAKPVPSLAGKTVTGGRLDIPAAMDALEAATKVIVIDPGEVIVDPLRESPPPGTAPAATVPPPPLPSCKVPKLSGKTLGQAKAALAGAGCRAGKVSKPKARPGQKPPALVVKSSSPAAGATAAGAVVALTLGPKPKRHRH